MMPARPRSTENKLQAMLRRPPKFRSATCNGLVLLFNLRREAGSHPQQ
ncbi:hypothetical protein RHECNPAF_9300114 [Rhizobium etli CNPAF512]|nr:hypothetical protein RHECNPAF_9300114 [Rhizobium etli CNPAF512]